ncbi:MAG: cytochrome C oxidase subunit II [Gemmatimonadaceae bacterium]
MKVDLYEKLWMWVVAAMLGLFFTSTAIAAIKDARHPPSHVETIDPTRVMADVRFHAPGVSVDAAGHVQVRIVGMTFAWLPAELTLPALTPVTFRVTSMDVVHGFEIVRTDGQTMVLPGYVSQFTTQLDSGDYLVTCNEYCGVGHHTMAAKLRVIPRSQWHAPLVALAPAPLTTVAGATHDDR